MNYREAVEKFNISMEQKTSQDSRSCRWCQESCLIMALPYIICPFRIRLETATSRTFHVMQCLPIVAVGSILRWNQFSDRQKRARQSDYRNGNETAKFTKNHKILSRKSLMGNFDGFLTIADYNEYTGQMSAFCTPRFRRNVSKTTGSYATGDGLVKTRDHIHWWWIWSNIT
jgi:hypothetical protein